MQNALLLCIIMQVTETDACVDKRKLKNSPCHAVAPVRGEVDLAFKTKRPDGGACFADVGLHANPDVVV